jgi:hypothetical protein
MENKKIKFLGKKNLLVVIFIALTFVFVCSPAVLAESDAYGLEETAKTGFSGNIPNKTDIPSIIGIIVGALLSFIGILFFILVIYGGYLWMTARGNEEQVGKSISIITQAAIGLIIVAAAYLITRFLGETILKQVIK